jgi:hypothetical protein
MTKITEVLKIIAPIAGDYTSISQAIAVAEAIESLYIFDAEKWVREHMDEYEGRRIAAIRDLRNVSAEFSTDHRPMGLKESKDIVDKVMPYVPSPVPPHPVDDYETPVEDEDGSLAYARMLERRAEEGTYSDPYYREPF